MSYTVLAVKWRPRRFDQLVGQEHVVRALTNSLAAERLHHAYLFSGTRGVGKTTIGRILAKALNCDTGVVAEPCGTCEACLAIDAGRFVDLIEVDAASRTKVDDTRELLDNVQYAPTHGRFKVYLIDEVHMLSNHSFNALLKTLEEPPPHVKFLLATTDPQKLPVTVLSRCLQFNLKKLTVGQIQAQLESICGKEQVEFEAEALRAIARGAAGSMRDALSLLDQAIAFGAGRLVETQVNAMLGTIDRGHIMRLLDALAAADGSALLGHVAVLDEQAPDYGTALDDLMDALQRLTVYQLIGSLDSDMYDEEVIQDLAARITAEDVQLYYQIALQGRRDLPVARDARIAFEMTLLRMLAFRPVDPDAVSPGADARTGGAGARSQPRPAAVPAARPASNPAPPRRSTRAAATPAQTPTARRSEPESADESVASTASPPPDLSPDALAEQAPGAGAVEDGLDWERLIRDADMRGAARQLAEHCVVLSRSGSRFELMVARSAEALNTEQLRGRLQSLLSEHLGHTVQLRVQVGEPSRPTPAQRRAASESERMRVAREGMERDPNVRAMRQAFDAVLEHDSVELLDKNSEGSERVH